MSAFGLFFFLIYVFENCSNKKMEKHFKQQGNSETEMRKQRGCLKLKRLQTSCRRVVNKSRT